MKKLEGFYRLISSLEKLHVGKLYETLTEEQKNDLNLSYDESFDEDTF